MAQTCPKCGYAQVETDECPRCRVVISRYRAYLEKLGQPPARPTAPGMAPPARPPSPGMAPPPLVERGIWPEGSPAGFWVRAAAVTVDSAVLAGAMLPFQLFIVFPTLLAGGIRRPDPARAVAVNVAYNLVTLLIYMGYVVWMHGRWGQTLGKVATGVKVVKVNGEAIGYGRAFGRLLGTCLSFILLGIGFLMAGFRSDKRALHDLVAGTRVMKVHRPWLEGRPAGFWMRYVALGIDWQVLAFPLALFGILMAIAIPLMAAGRVPRSAAIAVGLTLALFLLAFVVTYSVWMHGKWGQTLGKMALGMKVERLDGSPLGYGGAFLRWLGSILSGLILMIGYIMAGFRSDKRALHDLIAGSRVTYIR